MTYLVALKPLTHDTRKNSYAVLLEIDWEKQEVKRSIKIPSANFTSKSGYMRSHIQGITLIENKIYISLWNYIVIIDYNTFEVIDSFSHPLMSDLHGIEATENKLLICSTGIDTLLCFDRSNHELDWFWRPDDSKLNKKIKVPRFFGFLMIKTSLFAMVLNKLRVRDGIIRRIKLGFKNREYRGVDKTRSRMHFHHLNEVNVIGNRIIVLTKGWNNSVDSSLIEINFNDRSNPIFIANPNSFKGAHDIVYKDDSIFVTESYTESVGQILLGETNKFNHWKLTNNNSFVRGLCIAPKEGFIVGFTPSRNSVDSVVRQPILREYNNTFTEIKKEFVLNDFYTDSVGGAIHCIKKVDL